MGAVLRVANVLRAGVGMNVLQNADELPAQQLASLTLLYTLSLASVEPCLLLLASSQSFPRIGLACSNAVYRFITSRLIRSAAA